MVQNKIKNILEESFIILGSILIGLPLGLLAGIVCWIKFPFAVYYDARAKLAMKRIREAEDFLERHGQESKSQDILEMHIERMEAKKNNYDN